MTPHRLRLPTLLVLAGLLLWAVPSPAQTSVNISNSPGWQSACPRIAVDVDGNLHVVWAEIYTLSGVYFTSGDAFYSRYDITSRQWSTPINLSNTGQVANPEGYLVDIAVDASKNIYVVYINNSAIVLRVFSGGAWGAPFELARDASTIDQARVAVTPQGNIFACWWEIAPGVCRSRARIGGNWEPVRQISPSGMRCKFPDIAVGTNIAACAFMGVTDVTYHLLVTGRALTAGAAWTSPARPTNTTDQEQQPAVALDAADVAHIVYTPEFDTKRIIRYIFGTTAGFSAPKDLTLLSDVHYPTITVGGANLFSCWEAAAGLAYSFRIDGLWSVPAILAGSGGILYLSDLALSPGLTEVHFVWENGNGLGTEIYWSGPVPLAGNTPPIAEFSFTPATAIFPADIAFDASASKDTDGTIALYQWEFGDGGTGTGKTVTHNYKTYGTFTVKLTVTDNRGATASRARSLEILRLFQPLGIQVENRADESLFRVRYLNIVTWAKNPANEAIGATISTYRVYRKKKTEPDTAYAAMGEVPGTVFSFTDKTANSTDKSLYAYTVTSLTSEGKESPITGAAAGAPVERVRPAAVRRNRIKG